MNVTFKIDSTNTRYSDMRFGNYIYIYKLGRVGLPIKFFGLVQRKWALIFEVHEHKSNMGLNILNPGPPLNCLKQMDNVCIYIIYIYIYIYYK